MTPSIDYRPLLGSPTSADSMVSTAFARLAGRRPATSSPWIAFASTVVAMLLGSASTVCAQPATAPATAPAPAPVTLVQPIGDEERTSAKPNRTRIEAFVKPTVEALSSADPQSQRLARDRLINAAAMGTGAKRTKGSAQFQDVYATVLSEALLPKLRSSELRVRLPAAVVLAETVRWIDNTRLAPATLVALGDKSEPIVLWGVKAAKYVFPLLNNADQSRAMANGLIRAARVFPSSTGITEEVYEAFMGSDPAKLPAARRPAVLPYVIAMLQARAQAFKAADPLTPPEQQPGFPASPEADGKAATFLSYVAWATMPKTQQPAAGRALFNLTRELARFAPSVPPRVGGDAPDAVRRQDLTDAIKQRVSAFGVIGAAVGGANGPAIDAAAKALGRAAIAEPQEAALNEALTALETAMTAAGILGPEPQPLPDPATLPVPNFAPAPARAGAPAARATTAPAAARGGAMTRPAAVAPRLGAGTTQPATRTPAPAPPSRPSQPPAPTAGTPVAGQR